MLKKLTNLFLLVLMVGSLFVPFIGVVKIAYAEPNGDCAVKNAKFLGSGLSSVGPISPEVQKVDWFKGEKEKIVTVSVQTKKCEGKTLKLRIIALSDPRDRAAGTGAGSINVTKDGLPMTIDESNIGTVSFYAGEELCYDITYFDLEKTKLRALLFKVNDESKGITDEQYYKSFLQNARLEIANGGFEPIIPRNYKGRMPSDNFDLSTDEGMQKLLDQISTTNVDMSKTTEVSGTFSRLILPKGLFFNEPYIGLEPYAASMVVAKSMFALSGIVPCYYTIDIEMPDGSHSPLSDSNQSVMKNLGFWCTYKGDAGWEGIFSDNCDTNWEIRDAFTPGVAGLVDKTSLCYNQTIGDYDQNCYELLAPIPGFGRKINFGPSSEFGGDGFTLGTYIGTIIKIALGVASVVAVIFLTYAGIMYMTAGNSGGGAKLLEAKGRVINAGLGLLVLAVSWIILNTINPELLKINPKFEKVTFKIDPLILEKGSDGGGFDVAPPSNATYLPGPTGATSLKLVDVKSIANNLNKWDPYLKKYAAKNGVDCTLMKAVMTQESKGNPQAKSGVGARGLIQVMPFHVTRNDPKTGKPSNPYARQLTGGDVNKLEDPDIGLDVGMNIFQAFIKDPCLKIKGVAPAASCTKGDIKFIIAAYNGGYAAQLPGSCGKTRWECNSGGFTETHNYVEYVTGYYQQLKAANMSC